MTIYTDTGISIDVFPSLFSSSSGYISLTDEIDSYSHTIDAMGGYRSAQLALTGSQEDAEDWLENGLARLVLVYNNAGEIVWEGFVNQVGISIGGLRVTRGPVLDVANRVTADYTPLDTSVSPPVAGNQTTTTAINDTSSQALYGIIARVLSGGRCSAADMAQSCQVYLQDNALPVVNQQLDLLGGDAVKISLELAGFVEYLDKNPYALESTASTTVRAKLLLALAAEPNSILSTDYNGIVANTLATPAQQDQQSIWSVIKDLCALGDASYNRYLFGLYAGRKARYNAVPATFDYQMRLSESLIERFGGEEIEPWNVLPGRWLFYVDFLSGRGSLSAPDRDDPRCQLIESLTYTAPWGLSLSGGRTDKISQRLAQISGSGGI